MVYVGIVRSKEEEILVAVKTIKPARAVVSDKANLPLKGLLSEIKLLSYIGIHTNVVRLHGAHTAKLRDGEVYVVLEYCEHGSLESYLRSIKSDGTTTNAVDTENIETYKNVGLSNGLDLQVLASLFKWCSEIADGMEYLASKRV